MLTLREGRRRNQKGQITIMVVMGLAIFMLAFAGLATDYASFWYTRQSAQSAADATCQATAVDLYTYATGTNGPNMGFVPGTAFTCDAGGKPNAAPCKIAKLNGFDGTLASNSISVTFPNAVNGVTGPPGVVAFAQADVTNHAPTYFSKLLTQQSTVDVHASAVCGLTQTPGPVPIVVLHPTLPSTIDMSGSQATIQVDGGPSQSIQVNSNNASAVTTGSLSTINLQNGGPKGTGSSFGTFGGQASQVSSVNLGTTGSWIYPHLPVSDPYKDVVAPAQPGAGTHTTVAFGKDGCPDPSGCDEYTNGYYATGIKVKNGTTILQPGVYYLGGVGLEVDANSTVRLTACGNPGDSATCDGDGTAGVMLYFSGDNKTSIFASANSGSNVSCVPGTINPKNCIADYLINGSSQAYTVGGAAVTVRSRPLKCAGIKAQDPPKQVPTNLSGNVLLAPCGGTYGDPTGEYRGFLFFQDRSIAVGAGNGTSPPQWQGGGATLAAGFMYFHNCRNGDTTGTGVCDAYGDVFNMGGNPGSSSYVVGSLITDRIHVNGSPALYMLLHPDDTGTLVKLGFFQ